MPADSAPHTQTQTHTSFLAISLWLTAKPTKRVTTTNAGIMYVYVHPSIVRVCVYVPVYVNVPICGASLVLFAVAIWFVSVRPAAAIVNPDMVQSLQVEPKRGLIQLISLFV